jgi:sialate O-acetylesterase
MLGLNKLFSDGLVLQRDCAITVWGNAGPGEKVTVSFAGAKAEAVAGVDEKWRVTLPPKPAGGPFEMIVECEGERLRIQDVLLGDVWLLSGQSNMAVPLPFAPDDFKKELETAGNYPEIRQFQVPPAMDFSGPREDFPLSPLPFGPAPPQDEDAPPMPLPPAAVWNRATPDKLRFFSAVGYFFAKKIHHDCGVPVGLINSSVGGVPIESFMGRDALKDYPQDIAEAEKYADPENIKRLAEDDAARLEAWNRAVDRLDPGIKEGWHDPDFDDSGWKTTGFCDDWHNYPDMPACGSVWLRRELIVPPGLAGKKAVIAFGMLVEGDRCFVNGVLAGKSDSRWSFRNYGVKGGLKEGRNLIAVRFLSHRNLGRAVPGSRPETSHRVVFPEMPGAFIQLDEGEWKYRPGAEWGRLDEMTTIYYKPTCLYNAMIAPLHKYAIKGVCWYQGESHTERPGGYADRFRKMIADWREKWNLGDFPVFWVQLPNFAPLEKTAVNWAYMREEQRRCLTLPNSGMAAAIDAGDSWDMHPVRKAVAGERLALAALRTAYGRDIVAGGPVYRGIAIYGMEAAIQFESAGGGLATADGKKPGGFAVFDGVKQYPARAEIRGNEVVVKCPSEAGRILAVRYAWESDPREANLINKEGLPALPFDSRFSLWPNC